MLAEVDVSVGEEELANRRAVALIEVAMEDDTRVGQEQVGEAVQLIVLESAAVRVAVRQHHLALMPHIVLPDSLER